MFFFPLEFVTFVHFQRLKQKKTSNDRITTYVMKNVH